jgi:hypothetical protein
VRRISGPVAGLLAGALLALTPVAALMFKYTLVLAPGIVVLVVIGGREVVRARGTAVGRVVSALTLAVTAVWSGSCSTARRRSCRGCAGRCSGCWWHWPC